MQEFILRVNIERFQHLADQETDATKRDHLKRLLSEEKEKLQAYRTHLEPVPSWDRTNDGSNPERS